MEEGGGRVRGGRGEVRRWVRKGEGVSEKVGEDGSVRGWVSEDVRGR